jgi:hypothetical protein
VRVSDKTMQICPESTFSEKYFKKMKGLFKQWNKRNLTPIGKITVVKSLILPVLNHLFIALPNPSIEIIKEIKDMLYTFIWKSSVNRMKKDIMQKEYQEGGLKMINMHSFILALKSTWIRRLFSTIVNGRIFLCHQLI